MLKESEKEWLDRTIKKVTDKIDKVSVRSRFKIPYTTIDGIHDDRSAMNPTGEVDDGICYKQVAMRHADTVLYIW